MIFVGVYNNIVVIKKEKRCTPSFMAIDTRHWGRLRTIVQASTKARKNNMSGDADETKAAQPEQEPTAESEVIANRFTLTDTQGRERASLYVENELTLFAFNDKDGEPVFSIAVSLSGFVMLSANHRKPDGDLSSSFSLTVSNGEPEILLTDAIFGGSIGINTHGLFNPA
jgi:hypothetical protein